MPPGTFFICQKRQSFLPQSNQSNVSPKSEQGFLFVHDFRPSLFIFIFLFLLQYVGTTFSCAHAALLRGSVISFVFSPCSTVSTPFSAIFFHYTSYSPLFLVYSTRGRSFGRSSSPHLPFPPPLFPLAPSRVRVWILFYVTCWLSS